MLALSGMDGDMGRGVGSYIALLALALLVYKRCGTTPLLGAGLLALSKRVHSIFVLRCFNDGVATLLLFLALALFTSPGGGGGGGGGGRWRAGCVAYSLAVGVKMNVLLCAPGLLLLLLQATGLAETLVCLALCAGVQLALGAPFLARHPVAYLHRSFELGRVFFYKWTVNFKFLDEETFLSKRLSLLLLLLTLAALAAFAVKWLRARGPGAAPPIGWGRPASALSAEVRVGEARVTIAWEPA